jgi:hypothetical protein
MVEADVWSADWIPMDGPLGRKIETGICSVNEVVNDDMKGWTKTPASNYFRLRCSYSDSGWCHVVKAHLAWNFNKKKWFVCSKVCLPPVQQVEENGQGAR